MTTDSEFKEVVEKLFDIGNAVKLTPLTATQSLCLSILHYDICFEDKDRLGELIKLCNDRS